MISDGRWFYIRDFRVTEERRAIRLTSHNLRIRFHRKTFIERTKKKTVLGIYSFSTFAEVSRGSMLRSVCVGGFWFCISWLVSDAIIIANLIGSLFFVVDVFGVVVQVGKLFDDETLSDDCDPDEKYMLKFTLRDLRWLFWIYIRY